MESDSSRSSPEAAPRSSPAGGNGRSAADEECRAPADAFKFAASRLGEVKEYAGYFVGAKLDSFKLGLRNVALYLVLGIVAGIAGLGLLITAAALLLTGLAGAIGELFDPDRPWAGALIVGFVVLAGAIGGVVVLMRKLTGASRKRTIEKYESRKLAERQTYGTDVEERAREHVQRQEQKQQQQR